MNIFWVLFISAQILSAGHINYQQEAGYYETNPIYDEHPSKNEVYVIKAIETLGVYAVTKIYPGYKNELLIGGTAVCFGFMLNDKRNGISIKFRF